MSGTLLGRNKNIDYEFLIRRLEKIIGDDDKAQRFSRLLDREDIWQKLTLPQAIRWAEIAAALGRIKTSEAVISHFSSLYPDSSELQALKARLFSNQIDSEDRLDEDDILDPFLRYRRRKELIRLYMNIFRGREDCFARQWVNKSERTSGYVPVRREMTERDVEDHLKGRMTYGIYLLTRNSHAHLGVIDADLKKDFLGKRLKGSEKSEISREMRYLIRRLPELGEEKGLSCICEFSGNKGYHFWFIMEKAVPASLVRKAISPLVSEMSKELRFFKLEVFPKQDRLAGKGLGNLVKLPLGIHRLSGKPSFFIAARSREQEAQLEFLESIKRIPVKTIEDLAGNGEDGEASLISHPHRFGEFEKYPELALLEEKCDMLALIFKRCRHRVELTPREEKVLYGTISFLKRGRTLLHYIFSFCPDYNPHLVDYRMSIVRGTPLGCRKIHSLLDIPRDMCAFDRVDSYPHPLLHLPEWKEKQGNKEVMAGRVQNLESALELLKTAIIAVEQFLYQGAKK